MGWWIPGTLNPSPDENKTPDPSCERAPSGTAGNCVLQGVQRNKPAEVESNLRSSGKLACGTVGEGGHRKRPMIHRRGCSALVAAGSTVKKSRGVGSDRQQECE